MTYQIIQGDNRQILKTLEDRFKLRYKIDEKTGCWNWTGTKDQEGYGVIWDNRKKNNIKAHRLSLEIVGRKIDDKLVTLHQCDNKSCVNPNHLKEGTTQQNTKEAKERGPFEDGKVIKGGAAKVDFCKLYENIDKDRLAITTDEWQGNPAGRFTSNVIGDLGDHQKFFYCPKVSSKERHIGFSETISIKEMVEEMGGHFLDEDSGNSVWLPHTGNIYTHGIKHEYLEWCKENNKEPKLKGNTHPTVKPVDLMKYLIKLITPKGGTVLDPFNGSGSTGMAAVELGFDYIGCELDPEYVKISEARIAAWLSKDIEPEVKTNNGFDDLFE